MHALSSSPRLPAASKIPMQSIALPHTAWGCGPSTGPGPAPRLGKSAGLPGLGLTREQAGMWSAHHLPGTRASAKNLNAEAKAKKKQKKGHLFQKGRSKHFLFPFSASSAQPHSQSEGERRGPEQWDLLQEARARHKCLLNEQHLPYLHHTVVQSDVPVSY